MKTITPSVSTVPNNITVSVVKKRIMVDGINFQTIIVKYN